jgi:hypothetical protein
MEYARTQQKTTNRDKLRSTNKSHAQPGKHSLHGTIKAKGTGEVIIGATVSVTGYSTRNGKQ